MECSLSIGWTVFWLLSAGAGTTFIAMLAGGQMFMSIPLFTLLFPGASFGQIIGNLKVGSFCRGIGGIAATYREIEFRRMCSAVLLVGLGSAAGANIIVNLPSVFLIIVVLVAICFVETSPKLEVLTKPSVRPLAMVLVGLYASIINAGSGLMILAMTRSYYPQKSQVPQAKIHANFLELSSVAVSCLVHIFHGNVVLWIAAVWSVGSLLGGYFGGRVLSRLSRTEKKESGKWGDRLLRATYVFAVVSLVYVALRG